jgi:uncharacterized protein DUF6424
VSAEITAWTKILATMNRDFVSIGSAGNVPVYDGTSWKVFRNALTIYLGAENCADPVQVDALRENARSLLERYPATVSQLEKLGVRVTRLLNRKITNVTEVEAWAQSIFNTGPVTKRPLHVQDTIDLAYDDVIIEVKDGKNPVYVIPEAPRGEGVYATLDFSVPGSKTRYGPRHEYTKLAFAKQVPEAVTPEPHRPRGRPRKDGLMPGSPEAKEADRRKEEERLARQADRAAERAEKLAPRKVASISKLPHRRRRLVRKRDEQQAQTS